MGRGTQLTFAPTSRRGFTLIELTVVVAVVTILAATAMPGLLAARRSRETRMFFSDLRDLGVRARNESLLRRETFVIAYDESATRFSLEPEEEEEKNSPEEGGRSTSVDVPDGIEISAFRADGNDTTSGEWQMRFSPDGRSDGGGVQIEDAGIIRSWVVDTNGRERMLEGELPDPATDRWEAGENEQRL